MPVKPSSDNFTGTAAEALVVSGDCVPPSVFARVLNSDGTPFDGLYAAGNDQASVMGGHYPSGGINLGPAMTFGFVAGRHAAGADLK